MSKALKRQPTNPVSATNNSSNALLAGVVCLIVGLAVGYYFGKESAENPAPSVQNSVPSQPPAGNSAAFLQEETALKSALVLNSKDLNALIQLGNLYYDHGQFPHAVEYYGRALEIDPTNLGVRTDRGTSYWNMGLPDAAIAEFKKSLETDPKHAQTLYNLGVVYLNGKNNREEARNVWEKLLATNPNYQDRAKVEQQLSSLKMTTGSPAGAAVNKNDPSVEMQELIKRLQKR
jgi:tetratricopeptide (TPR) repeat protein